MQEFRFWGAFFLTLIYIIFAVIYYNNCKESTVHSPQTTVILDKTGHMAVKSPQTIDNSTQTIDHSPQQLTSYKMTDIEQNKINQKLPEIINPPLVINSDEDKVFTVVEQNPSFPGGDAARMNFLRKNIKYPHDAVKNNIDGKVIINFIVEKDGTVSNINVVKGIGGGCDDEAVRVAKLMPKWNPGMQSGRPVRVLFNMPINFQLKI